MKPIDKFILHVVHNLFLLNEYSEGEIKFLMNKFKEEAEDLNIEVSDEQLKKYIERFDTLKNSPKVTDKDLRKYSLSKLIKLVTSSPGTELSDDDGEDQTPDVVYQGNGITIWNGAKQGNCITYGASQKMPDGSRWCITSPGGSHWANYRYGSSSNYPTFYLAKNNNLSDSDILSFVALQVLDNGQYKFTNRKNNPGMEGPFNWETLNSRIPWLRNIPNLKNILKYIPFSKAEKQRDVYKNNPISIKQWIKEPFSIKKQYLIIRAGNNKLFNDISNDIFISKYLPQYPQIATMIAGTDGIININDLMLQLDKFSKQDQLSIAKQIRDEVKLDILNKDIPFDLKKYLVKTNKVSLNSQERLYVTKDNQAIVLLTLDEKNTKVGLYTEEDEYPSIKLNKRTSRYLLDYPELDKIPLRNLIKLVEDKVIDKEIINKIIEKAKTDPDSAILVSNNIILDSNSFASYKINGDEIKQIPFDNEEVQQIFADSWDNESLQQNAINLFEKGNIPDVVDKDALISIINAIPYDKRTINDDSNIVLVSMDEEKNFFVMSKLLNNYQRKTVFSYGDDGSWRIKNRSNNLNAGKWKSYFAYLRAKNKAYNDNDLITLLGNEGIPMFEDSKIAFISSNPPVVNDSSLKPTMNDDTALLINVAELSNSYRISGTGKLVKTNIPSSLARQLLGPGRQVPGQAAAQANAAVRAGRGRPAGQPNAPRPQAAPIEGGVSLGQIAQNFNLTPGFNSLGQRVLGRFPTTFRQVPVINNRGASRRQNLLGANGRIIRVFENGNSAIYIIRLYNGNDIASVVLQPGNSHYVVTSNNSIGLDSPSELLNALVQRNLLAELHHYIVNEYFDRNPHHLSEFKQLLRKHINEKKKQNESK